MSGRLVGDAAGTPRFPSIRVLVLLALAANILSVAAFPSRANAAPGWDLVLDVPSARFEGVDFPTANEGWLVAGAGLLHSIDGGATWTERAQLSGTDVDFYDASHGWLVGINGTIYATANGGAAWTEQASNTNVHLVDVVAVGPQEAWVVGSGEGFSDAITLPVPTVLLHTTDGGATWQHVGLPDGAWFRQLDFAGEHGWLLGASCAPPGAGLPDQAFCSGDIVSVVLDTTDAGATWAALPGALPRDAFDIDIVDDLHGWLTAEDCDGGCHRAPYRTTDGGQTWELVSLGPGVWADQIEAEDSLQVWAAGTSFDGLNSVIEVHHSTDGGASWSVVGRVPINLFEFMQRFILTQDRLFVTGGALASRSLNGATWERVETPALSPYNLEFVSAETGFALSGNNLVRSEDGGASWQRVGTPPGIVRSIDFLDSALASAWTSSCGRSCGPEIQRTIDGGATWQRVFGTDVVAGLAVRIQFVDPEHGWLVTEQGVFVTEDGGAAWQQRSRPSTSSGAFHLAADLAAPGHAWLIAYDDAAGRYRLYGTSDGARSWTAANIGDTRPAAVEFVDADHGWFVDADSGGLYATENGGATWVKRNDDLQLPFPEELVFVDRLNGWANTTECSAACVGQISHTADGGRTWIVQREEAGLVGSFAFVDVEHGWFLADPNRGIGLGGGPPSRTLLYQTTDGGGGPLGRPPKFPDVGDGPRSSSNGLLVAGLLATLGASLVVGAFGQRRVRR